MLPVRKRGAYGRGERSFLLCRRDERSCLYKISHEQEHGEVVLTNRAVTEVNGLPWSMWRTLPVERFWDSQTLKNQDNIDKVEAKALEGKQRDFEELNRKLELQKREELLAVAKFTII